MNPESCCQGCILLSCFIGALIVCAIGIRLIANHVSIESELEEFKNLERRRKFLHKLKKRRHK